MINFCLVLLEQLLLTSDLCSKQVHRMQVGGKLFFDPADSVNVGFMVEVVFVSGRRERDTWKAVSQSRRVLAILIMVEAEKEVLVGYFLHTIFCSRINCIPPSSTSRLILCR